MQIRFLFVIAAIVSFLPSVLLPNLAEAVPFFSEDFESYAMDSDVTMGANPWTITNTLATVETEAKWSLIDTKNLAAGFLLPSTVNFGPATTGGATTPGFDSTGAAPGGLFMVSGSDGLPPSLFPTIPGGSVPLDPQLAGGNVFENRIDNGTYTGASNDIVTPSFSTAGSTGDIWLHTSVSANLNDNGQAIFDVDVSTDGGATWINKFRRIAPGTGRNIASGDFDSDGDVDGSDFLSQQRLFDYSDCALCGPGDGPSENLHDTDTNRRGSDQRFSDWSKAFQGVYTPVVATTAAGNAGGVHGELDVNLGNLGGATDVKVRFRQFESRDDEVIAIDNVVVDELAPMGSATTPIYLEDFNSMSLGSMGVYTYVNLLGAFGTDSGDGSGTISGFSWGAQDRPTISYSDENEATQGPPVIDASGRYDVGVVERQNVNHLGHPTAEGPLGQVPFAMIDPQAEPEDAAMAPLSRQSERLHTPLLDLSLYDTVILEWDSETIFGGIPSQGSTASVVLMEDTDGTPGPSDGDTIIAAPDKLTDFFDPYVPYDQFGGGFYTGGDDPIFAQHRLDITSLVNMATDETKLYVAFQFFSSRTDFWAIDNVRLTGELTPSLAAAGAVPEPSSLLLALVGLPVFGAFRRRRPIG